jgi:uncharacterized protein
MRAPTDMPRRRRRTSGRGRVLIVVAAVVIFILVTSLRGLAGFYTDYLWFDNLGLTQVFTGILRAKIALGVIFTVTFFVICFVNLTLVDRFAPPFRAPGPEDEMLNRYHDFVERRPWVVRGIVSLVFGLITGVGVSSEWNQWILFTHSKAFGVKDATFHTDVSFYVFRLPFYQAVTQWLFASLIIILLITLVAAYLNGGIRLQSPVQRVTPHVKAHISVLLAMLALVKAVDYWLARYSLTFSTRGAVNGATYTDVKAQLPALNLLMFIALLSCGLFIYNIFRRGWTLPVVGVGLWALVAVVAGTAYPAFVQRFEVLPTESSKEAPYIANNITATRQAMGLTSVQDQTFQADTSVADASKAIEQNPDTVRNIRLLDPSVVRDTYQREQSNLGYTNFPELDVDRYPIKTPDGSVAPTQVVLSTRDLSIDQVPQKSWEGQHISYTHGYGVALSAANAVVSSGSPNYLVQNVPTSIQRGTIATTLDVPQVYFSERQSGYAIVGSSHDEVDYLRPDGSTATYRYSGTGGVALNSWVRKAAFAARFGDLNPLISNFVTDQSKILYVRDIKERVQAVAPFLQYDHDPYPVMADGKVVYILDAYTTSQYYPNAQKADTSGLATDSGLKRSFNYVRNSVKVVVDAYDGTVKMYVIDPNDPIVQAYRSAFPDLFTDISQLPDSLRSHLRFPEDQFKVQTTMWGRYHIDDSQSFYNRTNGWNVAKDPGTSVSGTTSTPVTNAANQVVGSVNRKIDPYYLIMRLPGEATESFVLIRPFVPTSDDDSKQKLTAFMVANSDPDHYGELKVYELPSELQVDGPALVNSLIQASTEVSSQVSLLNQNGSSVSFGNLLLIPIDQSLLWVRPLYVSSDGSTRAPQLKRVIVAFSGPSGQITKIYPTLKEALQQLFPGVNPQTFEGIGGSAPTTPTGPDTGSTTTTTSPSSSGSSTTSSSSPPNGTPEQLIAQAQALLTKAQSDLTASCIAGSCDLNAYQAAVKDAANLLASAAAASSSSTTTTSTSLTSPTATA